ncbi:hypothetical protein GCM10023405_21140 [Streptomonospora salina]
MVAHRVHALQGLLWRAKTVRRMRAKAFGGSAAMRAPVVVGGLAVVPRSAAPTSLPRTPRGTLGAPAPNPAGAFDTRAARSASPAVASG